MSRKRIGSFTATDASGKVHTLWIYQDFIESSDLASGPHSASGIKSVVTSDGRLVKRLDKGKYQIIGGMEPIDVKTDDPAAP